MRKVLIVDDEFLVRLGLKTTIDWPQYGYEIVGEASNGREALEVFDRFKPDILITDIKMPDMDGLELINEVKRNDRRVQIIIISNYGDFNYARQAMKLGVSQYLIKSEINRKKLLDMLQSLSFDDKKDLQSMTAAMNDQQKYIRSQLYKELSNSSKAVYTSPPKELFPETAYSVLECSCDVSILAANTVDILTNMLQSLIDLHFHKAYAYIEQIQYKIVSVIIVPVSHIKMNTSDCLISQGKMLANNIKQYSNADLIIGISLPGNFQRFSQMFDEAKIARQNCFFISDTISLFKEIPDLSLPVPEKISFSTIQGFIDNKDQDGLEEYIRNIFGHLKGIRQYKIAKNCFIDLLAIAKSIFEKIGTDKVSPAKISFEYESFDRMSSISIAEEYVHNLYLQIFDMLNNNSYSYSYFIKACLSFIAGHYSSNITLTDVAKAVNISSSYLSLVFKQEMGINFSDYLIQYRIEKAKELLTTTDLRIYEIAEKVGFSSPYYFSRVFKNVAKMTCKEYKNKFIKTDNHSQSKSQQSSENVGSQFRL